MRWRSCSAGLARSSAIGAGKPRHEDLLVTLRERDDRDAREVELLERGQRSAELSLSSVDDDEVRHPREALIELAVAEAREAS